MRGPSASRHPENLPCIRVLGEGTAGEAGDVQFLVRIERILHTTGLRGPGRGRDIAAIDGLVGRRRRLISGDRVRYFPGWRRLGVSAILRWNGVLRAGAWLSGLVVIGRRIVAVMMPRRRRRVAVRVWPVIAPGREQNDRKERETGGSHEMFLTPKGMLSFNHGGRAMANLGL